MRSEEVEQALVRAWTEYRLWPTMLWVSHRTLSQWYARDRLLKEREQRRGYPFFPLVLESAA